MESLARKSKRQLILDEALVQKEKERKRIEEILKTTGDYTAALHPLIETYLDAYEVYYIKHSEWREEGFKATKIHTNKSGARNEIKHPLAQQVEVWMDKKARLLNQLGLDSKNRRLKFTGPLMSEADDQKKIEVDENNKLVQFKKMRGGKN